MVEAYIMDGRCSFTFDQRSNEDYSPPHPLVLLPQEHNNTNPFFSVSSQYPLLRFPFLSLLTGPFWANPTARCSPSSSLPPFYSSFSSFLSPSHPHPANYCLLQRPLLSLKVSSPTLHFLFSSSIFLCLLPSLLSSPMRIQPAICPFLIPWCQSFFTTHCPCPNPQTPPSPSISLSFLLHS